MTQLDNSDDLLLDRLVDGELSSTEREQLLTSLDDREDGWRRCALAFLEAQAWRLRMRQFIAEPVEQQAVALPLTGHSVVGRRYLGWLAPAAGLLLAFTVGWLVRAPGDNRDIGRHLADTTIEQDISPEDIAENLGSNDVVTLLVRDADGSARRLRVPLVESVGLDNRLGSTMTSLPPGFRENLEQRGFDLQSRRRYAPLYFEQNEQLVPMIVPVDDAYVVPVSRPVY